MADETKKRARPGRVLLRVIVLLFLIFIGFYVVFYFAQTPMVFQSERELKRDPSAFDWNYEDIFLEVDGQTTHGWYLPVENPRGVIFFCHGNDGNMGTRLGTLGFFRSLGFSVLAYDYGGFGKSTGGPSETRVYADSFAMWVWLTETKGIPENQVLIWGRSFGGGAACELARHVKPAGVVLESTFSSMAEAAFADYPWFPTSIFLRHKFDNKDKVAEFDCPLLVIHSQGDTLYPFNHGQSLFEKAHQPKTFLEVYGDHGEAYAVSKDVYERGVKEFLETLFPKTE